MSHHHNPLFWSFGIGAWFGVRIRVSVFFPLLLVWGWWVFGWQMGTALASILFLSVLFHEFGHVITARAVGGSGDEILIWPFGGLAFVGASASPRGQFLTALGGPLVNLVVCGLTLYAVLSWDFPRFAFNPLYLPFASRPGLERPMFGATNLLLDLQVLVFAVNWMLLLVNLIPAYPMDGGRMLRTWLMHRLGSQGIELSMRLAYISAFLLALAAILVFNHVFLLSIAFVLFVLAMQEAQQLQTGEAFEDSFMGYDFSQGYTSLERADPREREPRPGFVQRWLDRRRAEKRRRQEQQALAAETQLDALLAKVHERGIDALTESEKRQLKRASDRYRSKDNEQR